MFAAMAIAGAGALWMTRDLGEDSRQQTRRPGTVPTESPRIAADPGDASLGVRPIAPPPSISHPQNTDDKPPVGASVRTPSAQTPGGRPRPADASPPAAVAVTKRTDDAITATAPAAKTVPQRGPTTKPAEAAADAAPEGARAALEAALAGDTARLQEAARRAQDRQPPRGDRKLARQLNARGLALSREGRYAEAAAEFRAAREADGSDPEVRENLGYALLKADRLAEAESELLSTVEIAPQRATAWGSLGFVHARRGRHREGVELMLAALRISPDPQKTLATYSRQARTESDPRVRAMLAEVVSRAPDIQYAQRPAQ